MIEQQTRPAAPAPTPSAPAALAARLSCAAAGGVAFGVLTLWLQGRLADSWNVLANSGAVWTVVAVALAAVFGTSRTTGAVAGLLSLLGEVAGYYWCAAPWHGVAVALDEQVLWTAAAVLIGPVAGLVGHGLARGTGAQRVRAALCVAGLFAGEGWYDLRMAQNLVAARVEVALAALVAVAAVLFSRASAATRAVAVLLGCAVAAAVLLAYSGPWLVL